MTDEAPITVNASPIADQAATIARDFGLIAAALPTLLALLGKHDLIGLMTYLGSSDVAPALGVIVTGAIVVYRQAKARLAKKKLVAAAKADPSAVVVK